MLQIRARMLVDELIEQTGESAVAQFACAAGDVLLDPEHPEWKHDAADCVSRALELELERPDDEVALAPHLAHELAALLFVDSVPDRAREEAERALERGSRSGLPYVVLGMLAERARDADTAREHAFAALDANQSSPFAIAILLRLGVPNEWELALRLVAAAPDPPALSVLAGRVLRNHDSNAAAIAYEHAASRFDALGMPVDAMRVRGQALEILN